MIVLQLGSASWQDLYHNTLHCIVAETLVVGRIVSQYSSLYCDKGKAWTVLQYSHRAHDTSKLGAGQGTGPAAGRVGCAAGRAGRRWGVGAGAAGARERAGMRARAGARARVDAQVAGAQGRAERRRGAGAEQEAAGARGVRQAGRRCGARGRQALGTRAGDARPGRAGWLRAVHSVHSACFRSGLTRYCS